MIIPAIVTVGAIIFYGAEVKCGAQWRVSFPGFDDTGNWIYIHMCSGPQAVGGGHTHTPLGVAPEPLPRQTSCRVLYITLLVNINYQLTRNCVIN